VKLPFRVQFEESASAELKTLAPAQQKTVDRRLAAAATLATMREHGPSDEWVEIAAGPVILECRADVARSTITVVTVRRVKQRGAGKKRISPT